jgi:hypothetical protein
MSCAMHNSSVELTGENRSMARVPFPVIQDVTQ